MKHKQNALSMAANVVFLVRGEFVQMIDNFASLEGENEVRKQ